jgi:ribonuclease P/MRP protein subunit POP1
MSNKDLGSIGEDDFGNGSGLDNREIKISKFINTRSEELIYFKHLLKTKVEVSNKTPAQIQPKHMRRRAMAHNRYRVPSRIRQ